MKRCSTCELEKLEIEFNKKTSALDGLQNTCRQCMSMYHKGFKKERKSLLLLNQNKKHCKKCDVIYDLDNFFKNKGTIDNLSAYCKSCTSKVNADYNNRIKIIYKCVRCLSIIVRKTKLQLCSPCYDEHRKEYRKNFEIENRSNLEYRLKNNISRSIRAWLKSRGFKKERYAVAKFLPYTMNELKAHIKNLFEPWMTWRNHGIYNKNNWNDNDSTTWIWQIDHIIPHNTFQYNDMNSIEFLNCWNLSNLRPLSAKQNISEGSRRTIK